jgi:hypothetical protein
MASAAAASGALLTGCKGIQALGTPPPAHPDIVALRSAISAEELMVARYATVVARARGPGAASPTIVAALTAVAAEHAAHLAQLKSRLVEPAGSTPSPRSSPTVPVVPAKGTLAAEVAALEDAEQAASDRLIGQLGVLPPSLAQLFASIAASEATHVPYLQATRQSR